TTARRRHWVYTRLTLIWRAPPEGRNTSTKFCRLYARTVSGCYDTGPVGKRWVYDNLTESECPKPTFQRLVRTESFSTDGSVQYGRADTILTVRSLPLGAGYVTNSPADGSK